MKLGTNDISSVYLGTNAVSKVFLGSTEVWSAVDPDAQAFFDRVTTAGGTLSATEQTAVNSLVVQMKADGIWSKMKAVYPMVGASAAACAQNLKSSSFTGTFNGGWTFASTGAKANGTSGYMDTLLTPTVSLTSGNLHVSAYSRTTFTPVIVQDTALWGVLSSSNFIYGDFYNTTPKFYTTNGASAFIDVNFVTTKGLILTSITSTGTNGQKTYQNATLRGQNTNSAPTLPAAKIYFNALNNNNTSTLNFGDYEIALASIGDGLTNTEVSDFYTSVQAFQTTLSRQV